MINILLKIRTFLLVGILIFSFSCSDDEGEIEEVITDIENVEEGQEETPDNENPGGEDSNNDDSNNGGSEEVNPNDIVELEAENAFGLNPELEPWENFDLTDWGLDTPAPRPEDECRAVRIDEDEWDTFRTSTSEEYFFTHTDGGMRFVSPVGGVTTSRSCDSGFPRSELREQLRRGDRSISTTGVTRNNWALGYQEPNPDHGGRNGVLTATLIVNKVTTTGDFNSKHPGRTIIGQIHAKDDEPARLYYRKCPDNEYGSIYLEHEIRDVGDVTFNLMGSENCIDNPSNGFRLGELFSYEIINEGQFVSVYIYEGDIEGQERADAVASTTVDMTTVERDGVVGSGYDEPTLEDGELEDEWMYFKAGAYTQNNTGDPEDTDIITFYRLSNTHDAN